MNMVPQNEDDTREILVLTPELVANTAERQNGKCLIFFFFENSNMNGFLSPRLCTT